MTRSIPRVLLVLTLITATAATAEPMDLKLSLDPGDQFHQTMQAAQQIEQSIMGQVINMDQVNAITYTSEVLDRPSEAGGVWVATRYERVTFKQTGPMGATEYDSDNPPAGELSMQVRPLQSMVGQEVRFEITPDGEIHGVEGFEKMINDMVDAMDLPPGEIRDMTMQTMKQSFNDESMRQMLGMSMGIYPSKPVTVGDSWDANQAVKAPFPMQIDTVYRLEAADEGTATLAVDGTIKPGEGEGMQMGGAQMKVALTGTQKGQTVLDTDTGWVKTVDLEQDMSGEMTMTPAPGQGETMTIPMKIKGKITIRPAGEMPAASQPAVGGPMQGEAEAAE